jgi:predicted transcriptional regulator
MAKVNVSMPDALLAEIDGLALELHRTRSGLVQEAAAHYVADLKGERARIAHEQRVLKAMEAMRQIALEVGPFDATAAIRADRDGDHGHQSPSSPGANETRR